MSKELEQLLTRLEELSAQAVDCSDPSLHERVDTLQIQNLVRERGELIQQLPPVLAAQGPVSYVEWNRIVIIHHQGSRIHENIERARNRLVVELSVNCSGRVFLDRMTGMLG